MRSAASPRSLARLSLAAALAGCGSTPKDETAQLEPREDLCRGQGRASTGGYDKAIKRYERLEGRAAGTLLAQQAQLELAYAHYKTGEQVEALATLDRFIKLHPTSPALDYALYLQGHRQLQRQPRHPRQLRAARTCPSATSRRRAIRTSRSSNWSSVPAIRSTPPTRALRMNYIVNSLAAYEVHVARYYYRRGAYVAAANRAQQTVQEFQQSPSTEEALFIMVRSYESWA